MSQEASAGEKSHEATPERLKKARERGEVPVSPEVAVLASYAGLLLGLAMAGTACLRAADALLGPFAHPEALAHAVLSNAPVGLSEASLLPVVALTLPASALVVCGLIVQRGFVVTPTRIKPDLKKLNPVENAKKKYGPAGLGEFARGGAKVTAAAILGGAYLWSRRSAYLSLVATPTGALPDLLRAELVAILAIGCLIAAVTAVIDLPVRRLRHAARLRMSHKEVQDETKEQEGDPTQKQSRRKRAGEIARNQMLRDTASADVVIVNPTHYAVALKWDRQSDTVPVCVAKGTDHLALALRERARAAGVPVREDRTTVRALHATVEVGGMILPEHYAAVAAAIRFAEGVKAGRE